MTRHEVRELQVQGHTISVVERIVSTRGSAGGQRWYRHVRTPVAVLVRAGATVVAFDMSGSALDPSALSAELNEP